MSTPDVARPLAAEPHWWPLDRRVVTAWLVHRLVVLAVVGAGVGLMLAPFVAGRLIRSPGLAAAVGGALAVLVVAFLAWPVLAYRAFAFRLDGRVLECRSGVVFRIVQLLPLSRLQHVDLTRGPIERGLGLASLVLHTAGTHQASLVIPGLPVEWAGRLRDHLVEIGGDDGL